MAKPKINLLPMLQKMSKAHEKMEPKGHEKKEMKPMKKGMKGKGC